MKPFHDFAVLLMSPLMSYNDRWGQYTEGAGDTFPIGLGTIGSVLEMHGYPTQIAEPDILRWTEQDVFAMIERHRVKLVGISAFSPNVEKAFTTCQALKKRFPAMPIVIGGAHPTLFPRECLDRCAELDFVVTHEGEIPMLRLCECLHRGGSPEGVPNLWYRDGPRAIASKASVSWLNLDSLPTFPYEKFDLRRYTPAPSLRCTLPTFNYMAQRGCPFECSFCDTRTHGRKVRYRSVPKVIDDLEIMRTRFGVNGLIFEGSNFTIGKEYVRDLCQQMIRNRLVMPFYAMGRVDLDLGLIPLLKRAGLWCMSFGIESGNQATLQKMRKGVDLDQTKETIRAFHAAKIKTIGSFILGYPGETEEDVMRTIDFSCRLPLDVAVFFIPVPFPGSLLHEHAVQDGGLKKDMSWADYSAWLDHNHPIYVNPLIGTGHVDLYNTAFRRFYMRPRYLMRQLRGIRSLADFMRLFQGFMSVKNLVMKGAKALLKGGSDR